MDILKAKVAKIIYKYPNIKYIIKPMDFQELLLDTSPINDILDRLYNIINILHSDKQYIMYLNDRIEVDLSNLHFVINYCDFNCIDNFFIDARICYDINLIKNIGSIRLNIGIHNYIKILDNCITIITTIDIGILGNILEESIYKIVKIDKESNIDSYFVDMNKAKRTNFDIKLILENYEEYYNSITEYINLDEDFVCEIVNNIQIRVLFDVNAFTLELVTNDDKILYPLSGIEDLLFQLKYILEILYPEYKLSDCKNIKKFPVSGN